MSQPDLIDLNSFLTHLKSPFLTHNPIDPTRTQLDPPVLPCLAIIDSLVNKLEYMNIKKTLQA